MDCLRRRGKAEDRISGGNHICLSHLNHHESWRKSAEKNLAIRPEVFTLPHCLKGNPNAVLHWDTLEPIGVTLVLTD